MNLPGKQATLGMSKFSNREADIVTSTNNLESKMPATSNGVVLVQNPNHPKKSVYVAYFLWLFGGIFGMHHYYLGRDRHGFVWWTTLGGFGVGWIGEVLKVQKYVKDANEDEKFMAELIRKMQRYPKVSLLRSKLLNYLHSSTFLLFCFS